MLTTLREILETKGVSLQDTIYCRAVDAIQDFPMNIGDFFKLTKDGAGVSNFEPLNRLYALAESKKKTGEYRAICDEFQQIKDRLKEMGCKVIPINFGAAAGNKKKYPDIISEMWFNLADMMDAIGLPQDNQLLAELTSRQYKYTPDERRKVESKEEYKKRTGRHSPDSADACILCFYNRDNVMSVSEVSTADLGL